MGVHCVHSECVCAFKYAHPLHTWKLVQSARKGDACFDPQMKC